MAGHAERQTLFDFQIPNSLRIPVAMVPTEKENVMSAHISEYCHIVWLG